MPWFIDSSSTLWFFASLTHWFIGSTTHFTKCNVQPWLRWVLDRVSFCQNCFEILSFKQIKMRTKWKTWDNLGKVRKQEKTWKNTDVLRCIELRTMKPNLIDHVPLQVLNFHPKVLQLHFFFPHKLIQWVRWLIWHIDSLNQQWWSLTHWFIGSDSSTQQFTRSLVHSISCAWILSISFASQPPSAHSLVHLTTWTIHCFCIAQTLPIGHWFLMAMSLFRNFRPAAGRTLPGRHGASPHHKWTVAWCVASCSARSFYLVCVLSMPRIRHLWCHRIVWSAGLWLNWCYWTLACNRKRPVCYMVCFLYSYLGTRIYTIICIYNCIPWKPQDSKSTSSGTHTCVYIEMIWNDYVRVCVCAYTHFVYQKQVA